MTNNLKTENIPPCLLTPSTRPPKEEEIEGMKRAYLKNPLARKDTYIKELEDMGDSIAQTGTCDMGKLRAISSAIARLACLELENTRLEKEINKLKSQYSHLSKDSANLLKVYNELIEDCKKLEEEIAQLKQKVTESNLMPNYEIGEKWRRKQATNQEFFITDRFYDDSYPALESKPRYRLKDTSGGSLGHFSQKELDDFFVFVPQVELKTQEIL